MTILVMAPHFLSLSFCCVHAVWPDDGMKNYLISPKNAQNVATHLLHNGDIIRNSPKWHQNIWATFVWQFVADSF